MTEMLFNLVANDPADRRATHRAGGAAAGQDGAPTAPTPAPIAVFFSCADIPEQPQRPNSTATAAELTANFCIVFIWNASVLNTRCSGNSCPAVYLP
jgi:hypothetical protein